MNCSSCGRDNPDQAKFCLECGAAFAAGWASCGTVLPAGAKFCLECGTAVSAPTEPAATENLSALARERAPADYTEAIGAPAQAQRLAEVLAS